MQLPTLQSYPPTTGGALYPSLYPMSTTPSNEGAVIAAANVHWAKLRLSRINAALDLLQALKTSIPTSQLQNIQCKEHYLLDLQRAQHLFQSDARHFTIVTSRKEATSPGGLPQWDLYMERLVYYRHMGRIFCQTQPDCWRDEVLEHVESMSKHARAGSPFSPLDSGEWIASPADDTIATLSPATAEHLLLFEESQVAVSLDLDARPHSQSESPSSSTLGYDTDPGTPYVSEQGTESDSLSSGPMSPIDDFVCHDVSTGLKPSSPLSLSYALHPSVQILRRQFLVPADAPKSKPFSYEDIYTLYDIFDKTGIEYYIFERKRDSLHQMEVKSCQKVDLLRPFVEISRRFSRPTTHTQIPLEILLRMSRVIVNSFSWPQSGETWREFLGARTEKYRREKEELDARIAPELRRAEHADFCYSFMITVTEYIGSNPALLDSTIDTTRLRDNEKWDYVLAYRCIWENLGLIRYSAPVKNAMGTGLSTGNQPRPRSRPRLTVSQNEGFSRLLGHNPNRPSNRLRP